MSQIRANTIVNEANNGSPTFPFGISGITSSNYAQTAAYAEVAGIATNATNATNAEGLTGTPDITVGNIVAADGTFSGDVSIAGTISYEDVTNVDSVGVITARQGIDVTSGGINVVGVVTATSFDGDGSGLTGVESLNQMDIWLYGG